MDVHFYDGLDYDEVASHNISKYELRDLFVSP